MQNERVTRSTGRLAPLAQVALAALVAGSLLTFSTIAFRTAFDEPSRSGGVEVSSPRTKPAAPVVLPTPPKEETVATAPEVTTDLVAEIVATNTPRTLDAQDNSDGSPSDSDNDKDKKKNDVSKPRVSLPWPGSNRTLSGYDSDDGDHGKKGHQKSNGDLGNGHIKHRGRGHDDHDHKGRKGHGHSKGKKH